MCLWLGQAGADRGRAPESVQRVSGSEELPRTERHQRPAAAEHHHHAHAETDHRPEEGGLTLTHMAGCFIKPTTYFY